MSGPNPYMSVEPSPSAPVQNNPQITDPNRRYTPAGDPEGMTQAQAQEYIDENDPTELREELQEAQATYDALSERFRLGDRTHGLTHAMRAARSRVGNLTRRLEGTVTPLAVLDMVSAERAKAALGKNPAAGVQHAEDVHQEGQGGNAYTRYIQGVLLERLPEVIASFGKNNKIPNTTVNIHRLKDDVPSGPYVGKISHGTEDCGISSFLHATPAQLSHLVPILRFYIVDQKGNKQEIYFSDHSSAKRIKKMADIRAAGSLDRALTPRSLKGSNVGIKSFTWNYNNKHEGDRIIEANLELYFGDMADLASGNYLEMLFTSGEEDLKASEFGGNVNQKKVSAQAGGITESARETESKKTFQEKLQDRITAQKKALKNTKAGVDAAVRKYRTANLSKTKKAFRQVLVVVGWSLPKGSEKELKQSFISEYGTDDSSLDKNKQSYESFMQGVKNTQRAILLNLADYNVSFNQNGTSTLSMKYIGSTDNYLATNASDILGSNNIGSGGRGEINSFYEPTSIVLTDVNDSLGDKIKATLDQDPYLKNCGVFTNFRGEGILTVTLAGLDFAASLVKNEILLTQAISGDVDESGNTSAPSQILKERTILLDRLKQRAINKRLKDLYSGFLKNLIGGKTSRHLLKRGLLVVKDVNKSKEVKLHLNLSNIEDRERKKEFEKMINDIGSSSEPQAKQDAATSYDPEREPTPIPSETFFYYMRLGDILTVAMENAGFRDDISVVLGNTNILSADRQEIMSLYDIPITLGTFGQYFYDFVVQRQVQVLPFRTFFNQFLKIVANVLNKETQLTDRINFDYTVVTSYRKTRKGILSESELGLIGSQTLDPLAKVRSKYKAHHYYTVFVRRVSHKNRRGNRTEDECTGVYHYVIGSDRGIAKKFNFSRQNVKYFQEQLIESNNDVSKIQALFLPQNVSLDMYGNGIHRNGDLIFIDSRAALGTYASEVLSIGGYYRVVRSNHTITPQGYNTKLDCVFELRVPPRKKRKKANRSGGSD